MSLGTANALISNAVNNSQIVHFALPVITFNNAGVGQLTGWKKADAAQLQAWSKNPPPEEETFVSDGEEICTYADYLTILKQWSGISQSKADDGLGWHLRQQHQKANLRECPFIKA